MSGPAEALPDPDQLNSALIKHMKEEGTLTSTTVEAAFRAVPRHLFLSHLPLEEVYRDQAITTKLINSQPVSSSSQPSIMAIMLQQLDVLPNQSVLEIGAGTGYNAALLSHLVGPGGNVVTIDIDQDIVEQAQINLKQAGCANVQVVCADGALGFPALAPYDRIMLTVHSRDIAPAWREQLASAGRLVLPLSLQGPQVSVAFDHQGDHLESVSTRSCGFIELRGSLSESNQGIPGQIIPLQPPEPISIRLGSPSNQIDGATIFQLLHSPYQEVVVPMQMTREELASGFILWLSMHHPAFCELIAFNQLAEKNLVPPLFQYNNKVKVNTAIGLVGKGELSLLTWDDPASVVLYQTTEATTPLGLKIRWYGSPQQLAEELKAQLLAWKMAGRPTELNLRILAYALTANQEPLLPVEDPSMVVVIRRYTRFVCTW